jgi:cellulose synthase/poly-beta-1,6-N-acetylglucosamine synthase-like glycosyltransferase
LIDTHNHERFVEQAVVSALEQDFPAREREIIVVDDFPRESGNKTGACLGASAGASVNIYLSASMCA